MDDNRLGRLLTYALRHHPDEFGLCLTSTGEVNMQDVVNNATLQARCGLTVTDLQAAIPRLVAAQQKQRLALSADGTTIRANYGHSVPSVTQAGCSRPAPRVLYHGTSSGAFGSIMRQGLLPGGRQCVHCTTDLAMATSVGQRHVKKGEWVVVLTIDTKASGAEWRLSSDTWLTPNVVPPACIDVVLPAVQLHCSGIIVLASTDQGVHVCLVRTHAGYWGFPKGKRHKGEGLLTAALRECQEECGLTLDQMTLCPPNPRRLLLEMSNAGKPSVLYFVAHVDTLLPLAVSDTDELVLVQWEPVASAAALLAGNKGRDGLLAKALQNQ